MPGTDQRAVLLVEDDVSLGKALAHSIEGKGLRVERAGTKAEALEKLGKARYKVVLLDLILPDGSGHAVIDFLKARALAADTTVVVITGANADHLSGLDRTVVKSILFKPVNVDNLAAYVHILSLRD